MSLMLTVQWVDECLMVGYNGTKVVLSGEMWGIYKK